MIRNLTKRSRQPLSPGELAEAAILADLALVVVIVTRLTPLASFTQVLGCIPFAVLAMRHRLRVVTVSFWIAFVLTFLLAGYGEALNVVIMVVWGAIAGRAVRNDWGWGKSLLWSLTLGWVTTATITIGFFLILSRFRELFLEAIERQAAGIARFTRSLVSFLNQAMDTIDQNPIYLGALVIFGGTLIAGHPRARIPGFAAIAALASVLVFSPPIPDSWVDDLENGFAWGIDRWWILIPAVEFVFGIWMTYIVRKLARPIGERISKTFGDPGRQDPLVSPIDAPDILPVPLSISNTAVHVKNVDLFHIDDLRIVPGELVVLAGANGAGKSTLFRMLADLEPNDAVTRPGRAGLGESGGTALIGQRPESQVLGARVIDDLRWGLVSEPPMTESQALALTGLGGFELRETSTLSGGELQRLVVAGALLRQPALVLSDESTSMLSPAGREQIMSLLRRFADEGSAVVHITHIESEFSMADKVLHIHDRRLVQA